MRRVEKIERTCLFCQNKFFVHPCRARTGAKYCSHVCYSETLKNTLEDVWNYVDLQGYDKCWKFKGYRNDDGYGNIAVNKKSYMAHRLIFELLYGPIPEGILICHTCDNPLCCNPYHLFKGTPLVNMMDKIIKKRANVPCGEDQWNSKLLESDVKNILLLKGKCTQKKVGELFNIDPSNVSNIWNRKTWKSLLL